MRRAPAASLLLAALVAAACGAGAPASGDGASSASSTDPSVVASQPVDTPASSSEVPASGTPSASAAPVETPVASAAGSASPASSSAVPTDSVAPSPTPSGQTSVCQPEGSNPNFWPGIAASVSWDVYCAVLPRGWSVASGKYRLANGGWLTISYKGPGGATLALSEGSFCADGSGCVPSGSDAGDASFGSMSGTLVAVDGGGFAIVAARGERPSWLMVTNGLDQATTVSLGAALARVGG